MASAKQLKANRENALKGGVKTEAVKGIARLNAAPVFARENVNNKFCGTNPISDFSGSQSLSKGRIEECQCRQVRWLRSSARCDALAMTKGHRDRPR